MKINEEIIDILKEYNIEPKEGLPVLIGFYYGFSPSYIPDLLLKKIFMTGIVEGSVLNLTWNTPLFEDMVNKFEWVKQYREAFRKKNKERGGTLKACVDRFKKFLFENPDVTVADIRLATNLYLNSVHDPEYLTSAHYFISKGKGVDKVNSLESWIEIAKEKENKDSNRVSLNNKMQ